MRRTRSARAAAAGTARVKPSWRLGAVLDIVGRRAHRREGRQRIRLGLIEIDRTRWLTPMFWHRSDRRATRPRRAPGPRGCRCDRAAPIRTTPHRDSRDRRCAGRGDQPGQYDGRIGSRSALIGLTSRSSGLAPPNNSASRFEMNENVTASVSPRPASVRRTSSERRRAGINAGRGKGASRGSGTAGIWS